jgi:hypothetical protein
MLARVDNGTRARTLALALVLSIATPSVAHADPNYGVLLVVLFAPFVGGTLALVWVIALLASPSVRRGSVRVIALGALLSLGVWVVPLAAGVEAWRSATISTSSMADDARASAHAPSWMSDREVFVTLDAARAAGWPLTGSDEAFLRVASPDAPTIDGYAFERPDGGTYLVSLFVTQRVLSLGGRIEPRTTPRALAVHDIDHDADLSLVGNAFLVAGPSGVELLGPDLEPIVRADRVFERTQVAVSGDVLWTVRADGRTIERAERDAPTRSATLATRAVGLLAGDDGTLRVETMGGIVVLDGSTLTPRRPDIGSVLSNTYRPWQVARLAWAFPAALVLVIIAMIQISLARRSGPLSADARQRLFFMLSPTTSALLFVNCLVLQATS